MVTRVEKYSSKVGEPKSSTSISYKTSFTISYFLYSYSTDPILYGTKKPHLLFGGWGGGEEISNEIKILVGTLNSKFWLLSIGTESLNLPLLDKMTNDFEILK